MKKNDNVIRKELQKRGKFIKWINPYFSREKMIRLNKATNLLKGKNFSRRLSYRQVYIKREDGTYLRAAVYEPLAYEDELPGLLWIHGGGYAMGVPEQDTPFIETLMAGAPCIAVLPDYRLSVEKPYPAALEDCYLALRFMKEHAKVWNIRENQLFIGGDSAGGGLCAAVTMLARDKKEISIAYQMPLYPMIDPRTVSLVPDNDAPVWNSRSNKEAWELYLNGEMPDRYAAPALEEDYSGLPPTLTYVGTEEPFYAETCAYVRNLQRDGVKVAFRTYKGCFHGFDIVAPHSKAGEDARRFLKEHFAYAAAHLTKDQPCGECE